MDGTRAIRFIKAVKGLGIKEKAAEEIVLLVEDQQGELATKADIVRLEEGQKRLENSIDQLEEGQKELRSSGRWAIGIALTALALLGVVITSQISDIRADLRLLLQSQQSTERAGQDRGN